MNRGQNLETLKKSAEIPHGMPGEAHTGFIPLIYAHSVLIRKDLQQKLYRVGWVKKRKIFTYIK